MGPVTLSLADQTGFGIVWLNTRRRHHQRLIRKSHESTLSAPPQEYLPEAVETLVWERGQDLDS